MGSVGVRVQAGSVLGHWLETKECIAFGRHCCGGKIADVNVAILRKKRSWEVFPSPVPSTAPGESPPSLQSLLTQVWFSSGKKKICMD